MKRNGKYKCAQCIQDEMRMEWVKTRPIWERLVYWVLYFILSFATCNWCNEINDDL